MAGRVRGQAGARARRRQQALDRLGDRAAARRRGRAARVHLPGRADRAERPRARGDRRRARSSPSATSAPTRTSRACSPRSARRSAAGSTCSSTRSPSPRRRISRAASPTRRATASGSRSTSAPTRSSRCARAAEPLMEARGGGSIVTMTYLGGERAVPHYNVMGVAKATLDASVHYLAWDLGQKNIRVNAISAGPVRTLAARSIAGFPTMEAIVEERAPLHRHDRRRRRRRRRRVPALGRREERDRDDAVRRRRVPRDGHVATLAMRMALVAKRRFAFLALLAAGALFGSRRRRIGRLGAVAGRVLRPEGGARVHEERQACAARQARSLGSQAARRSERADVRGGAPLSRAAALCAGARRAPADLVGRLLPPVRVPVQRVCTSGRAARRRRERDRLAPGRRAEPDRLGRGGRP